MVERSIGRLEGRMDNVEERLRSLEKKVDALLQAVNSARGGWKLLLSIGSVSAGIGALLSHLIGR